MKEKEKAEKVEKAKAEKERKEQEKKEKKLKKKKGSVSEGGSTLPDGFRVSQSTSDTATGSVSETKPLSEVNSPQSAGW